MKGGVFLGDRKLELREFPDPPPGPGDVILEIIFIVLLAQWSRDTPDSRRIPSPAERGRHHLGDELDRSEDERMRRIDRMHLHRDVRRPGERAVRLERGDHIV